MIDKLNHELHQKLKDASEMTFPSIHTTVDQDQAAQYPVEFLNTLKSIGTSPHNLTLKPDAPIMLLRNFDPPRLCKGTRLTVTSVKPHVLQATIITGNNKEENVFIPNLPLVPTNVPFEFKRLKFPIKLNFGISVRKSQDQILKVVGLNLSS
ncbi:uncharacterized protein LOC115210609 [Octopus sinensis]|uniref:Uncharacterized protein LOC115210609 n=1 Tax=Octopus sinensis TaxID=2607531 RepID=A0A6P7S9X4_9MOLL|nr:uncharacterized protein LOC115210609 [Octopus sinensis]